SFRANDRLTLRYFLDRFKRNAVFDPANLLRYSDGSTITSQNALIHETHIFSSTLLNDFRFSYSRDMASRGPASNAASVRDFGVNIPFSRRPKPSKLSASWAHSPLETTLPQPLPETTSRGVMT